MIMDGPNKSGQVGGGIKCQQPLFNFKFILRIEFESLLLWSYGRDMIRARFESIIFNRDI